MLTIRLQRAGKRNKPEFRIVLAEQEAAAGKKFIEVLGNYNPRTKDFAVKEDRVKYWMGQQVILSPTIHNLFVTKNLLEASKIKAFAAKAKAEPAAAETKAAAPEGEVEQPAAEAAPTDPAPNAEPTSPPAE